jgi:DNA-binding SARP family transcriptional activator
MAALRLVLLGPLDIQYDGQQLAKPPTLKSQSLFAYLALHRQRPQPRERLADLFWGDRPERKSRSSLSTTLWHLRRSLPNQGCLLSDARTVQFDPEFPLWLDVEEFEASAAHGDTSSLQAAVALYRGDFMEDFYDDWILNERYRLESLFASALERLMIAQEARQQYASAITTALRLIQHDALREDAYRLAMRAYCQLGRPNAAVDLYRRCQDVVRRELEAEPMAETRDLYESILTGCYEVTPAVEAVTVLLPSEEPAMEVLLRHRLIEETTSLLARDYTFSHHKIQEVIYAGTPHRHREYAHARVGLAMELVYGRDAEKWAAELAFHFEQGRLHDQALAGKAIAYCLLAGDQSRVMYAHGDAVDYYHRALALLKERGDYEQAARTLMKLGLTYHTALDFRRSREAYDEAFVLRQRGGQTQRPRRAAPHTLRLSHAEPAGLDPALAFDTSTVPVLDQLFSSTRRAR